MVKYISVFIPRCSTFSSFSSPPTLFYKLTWFCVTQGPLFSLLLKVNFHLYLAKLLHFPTLLSSFPFYCVFVETSSADSHRKKRKIPSAHTHPYLQHCLPQPSFPSPPNVPSSNIYPIVKHSTVATHDRRVGVRSHRERSASECKKGESETFFCNKNCKESYQYGYLSLDPVPL